jgi:hypothetical protein
MNSAVFSLEEETIWFKVSAVHVCDIREEEHGAVGGSLQQRISDEQELRMGMTSFL